VLSQTLRESGPGIVKPSQQIKITCTVSGFELSSYGVHWVRQLPESKLEWIEVIWAGGSTTYADSLKSRLSITRDNAKKEVYLQMNTAETKDSGTYYYARDTATEITDRPLNIPFHIYVVTHTEEEEVYCFLFYYYSFEKVDFITLQYKHQKKWANALLPNPAVKAQTNILKQAGSSSDATGHLTLERFTVGASTPGYAPGIPLSQAGCPDQLWMPEIARQTDLGGSTSPPSPVFYPAS
ncbi:hypothetical protein AB205_0174830, partial [Aquarana catesbeiana]